MSKVDREKAITWLIERLPKLNRDELLAVGSALSTRGNPWVSINASDTSDLYNFILGTTDSLVQGTLDTALASAKGLYFDGINNYNDVLGGTSHEAVDAKFNAMSTQFPKSAYAANAAFYRAQYWTKLAQINQAEASAENIKKSNEAFDLLITRQKGSEPFTSHRFDADAVYFRALNDVLSGDEDAARLKLDQLAANAANNTDKQIYIYRFFYLGNFKNCKEGRLDMYFKTEWLASITSSYIMNHPKQFATEQGPCDFADVLKRAPSFD